MINHKLAAVFAAIELFLVAGGTWCAVFGIKNGFIDQRMKRGDDSVTGADAARAGFFYVFISLLCGIAAVVLARMWFEGRVHW